jgi:hypothetical protein
MQRRKFSREFKLEAVNLVRERGVLLASVLHFYSGRPLQIHSGVDTGIGGEDKAPAMLDHGGHTFFVDAGPQAEKVKALIVAFLMCGLKGDLAERAAIASGAVSFPGLSYKTTIH